MASFFPDDAVTVDGVTPGAIGLLVLAAETPTPAQDAMNVVPGTDVQPYSANLTEVATVDPGATGLALLATATAAEARTTLGVTRSPVLDSIPTIIASSTNSHVARDAIRPSILRAAPRAFQTQADSKTTPPTTWTAQNATNMASASVAAGVLSIAANTGATYTHDGSTNTGGGFYRDYPIRRTSLLGARVRCLGANENFEIAALCVSRAVAPTTMIGIQIGSSTGNTLAFRANSADVGSRVSISADAWYWIGFLIEGTTVTFLYSSATAKPTKWSEWTVHSTTATLATASTSVLRLSMEVGRAGTPSGSYAAEFEQVFDDEVDAAWWMSTLRAPDVPLAGEGYPTTSDTIKLAASADLLVAGLPEIAAVRLMLVDAINRLPGDAATWTWSLTGSASANPAAATTFQAAASLNLKDAGTDTTTTTAYRYWSLQAKYASTSSTQPGSLDLARIPVIPVAP